MFEKDYDSAPPNASCTSCKHCAANPKTGLFWCEVLARVVTVCGWCEDWQGTRPQDYASKLVEKY